MDIYRAREVLDYTKDLDNIKGTASSVAIEIAVKALDKQEKLQQFICEANNEELIKVLKQFMI